MKILHVEDDADILEIAFLALSAVGNHDVTQCKSGAEALRVAPGLAPDMVLLDVMMPEMTGPELMQQLREVPGYAHTPVVFMTARAQANEVAELRQRGATGVIVKPFDPMTLAADLEALCP